MTAFIVKYALSKGIQEFEADLLENNLIKVLIYHNGKYITDYYHKREWCGNIEDAKILACRLKGARIKSLEKSLAKVKKLTF